MKVNALDLSPNFAGTLMGLTNGISAITGIIAVSHQCNMCYTNWSFYIHWIISALYSRRIDSQQNVNGMASSFLHTCRFSYRDKYRLHYLGFGWNSTLEHSSIEPTYWKWDCRERRKGEKRREKRKDWNLEKHNENGRL